MEAWKLDKIWHGVSVVSGLSLAASLSLRSSRSVGRFHSLLVERIPAFNALKERVQRVEDTQCRKTGKPPAPHHSSSLDLQNSNLDAVSGSAGKRTAYLQSPTTDINSDEFD